jgi:NDP-sugar pyrophosphorylase family protein
MVEYKVLITTSGVGSRLGELTNYTNKCLIRVSEKPSISYIIESYPDDVEFIITLGHYGNHVKQFLELCYPTKKFKFVYIDKYQGYGSSLGYSLSKCESLINCPFIFHVSDTIISDYTPITPTENYVISSIKENSSQYRTIQYENNKLIKIKEKGELNNYYSYIGVSGIKDYELFFKNLKLILEKNNEDISDVHVINEMLSNVNFKTFFIKPDNWYDIGNTTELSRTKKSFNSSYDILDKKDESIFFFNDFVIKFFFDTTINKNRIKRGLKLKNLVPRILGHTDNFYKYELVKGNLFSKSVNVNSFRKFLIWSKNNLWIENNNFDVKNLCYEFYIKKTKKRIEEYLVNNPEISIINNENIPSIHNLIKKIDVDWLSNGIPTQFHGDYILDNIIEIENGFKLIDWRQDFGGELEFGDIYYDLAKLNHNLYVNHDIVKKNLFDSSPDNCYILINSTLNECREVLHSYIKQNGYDLKKIELLTALIWINMAPLHEYPLNNFLFNFGKYNLHKILTKYD